MTQTIICTNAGILLIQHLETIFSEIISEIHIFPFKNMHFKMSPAKWRPFCISLNVLSWYRELSISNKVTNIPATGILYLTCDGYNGMYFVKTKSGLCSIWVFVLSYNLHHVKRCQTVFSHYAAQGWRCQTKLLYPVILLSHIAKSLFT